jgi:hypothetical protein
MANFNQKHEKVEISPNFTQTAHQTFSHSIIGPTNDIARVYASPTTPNDVFLQPQKAPTTTATASSTEVPAATGHEKSALLHVVFESKASIGSTASATMITALKMRSESVSFMEIYQKLEKSPIFTKNDPDSFVSSHSKDADIIYMQTALTTIVSKLRTRSESTSFAEIHQKLENPPIFPQMAPESLISGCFFTDFLPTPSILPTKHPCDSSGLYFFVMFLF